MSKMEIPAANATLNSKFPREPHNLSETAQEKEIPPVTGKVACLLHRLAKRRGRFTFVDSLPSKSRVLDIGCGNDSPIHFKNHRPDCHYIGLDVGDYNQNPLSKNAADEYIITEPEHFHSSILRFQNQMDAVISNHNLEHCDAPVDVLAAMIKCLKPGGVLYLATPCEESVRFPKRKGTLNFFDDHTHKTVINWEETLSTIAMEGLAIEFLAKRYRPVPLLAIGILLEPVSALLGKVGPASTTWSLYGFESVIWAYRPKD
jgi:SAM-dependent methyltransferase